MTLTTSWAKAWRAHENRAYVRELLGKREPAFAAELATAEQDFPCRACPCRLCSSTTVTLDADRVRHWIHIHPDYSTSTELTEVPRALDRIGLSAIRRTRRGSPTTFTHTALPYREETPCPLSSPARQAI